MGEGIRVIGWGPFRLPGERRRMRKAEERAEEMTEALRNIRSVEDPAEKIARMWASWAPEAKASLDAQWPVLAVTMTQLAEARGYLNVR